MNRSRSSEPWFIENFSINNFYIPIEYFDQTNISLISHLEMESKNMGQPLYRGSKPETLDSGIEIQIPEWEMENESLQI